MSGLRGPLEPWKCLLESLLGCAHHRHGDRIEGLGTPETYPGLHVELRAVEEAEFLHCERPTPPSILPTIRRCYLSPRRIGGYPCCYFSGFSQLWRGPLSFQPPTYW